MQKYEFFTVMTETALRGRSGFQDTQLDKFCEEECVLKSTKDDLVEYLETWYEHNKMHPSWTLIRKHLRSLVESRSRAQIATQGCDKCSGGQILVDLYSEFYGHAVVFSFACDCPAGERLNLPKMSDQKIDREQSITRKRVW